MLLFGHHLDSIQLNYLIFLPLSINHKANLIAISQSNNILIFVLA